MLGWIKWHLFPENTMDFPHHSSWDSHDGTTETTTWSFVGATLDQGKSASHAPTLQSASHEKIQNQNFAGQSPLMPW
jgi:hypothetical protein